jgi:hypothetical protein
LLIGLVRRTVPRLLGLPALWFVIIFVALIRWTMLTLASQGRLLFPAISGIAILITYGLVQFRWSNRKQQIRILNFEFGILNLTLVMFLIAFPLPIRTYRPNLRLAQTIGGRRRVPSQTGLFSRIKPSLLAMTRRRNPHAWRRIADYDLLATSSQ